MNTPPRLIYYSDAHHYHAKRLDPPLNRHKLRWPIDELVGTGVDMLAFGLGYGDVFFHQTNIGRVVGQEQEVWEHFIDWRIMRMVKDAHDMGTDQVREVIERGREMGIPVFPSLKLQDPAARYLDRCGWLKWRHGMEVTLGEGNDRFPAHATEWCLDYTNVVVRENKKALIREMLEDYRAEGIELDFMFFPLYFRNSQTDSGTQVMTKFVADIKALANEVGYAQGPGRFPSWRASGTVATTTSTSVSTSNRGSPTEASTSWSDRYLTTCSTRASRTANGLPTRLTQPAPRHTFDRAIVSMICVPKIANIEMFRAFSHTIQDQGFAGMYLGYLPWPFAEAEYRLLREMAYPEMTARLNKRYYVPPREELQTYVRPDTRMLPVVLEEGVTERIPISVADDVDSAITDGEMREAELTLAFQQFCVEDEVALSLNGTDLTIERSNIYEPSRGQYWLRWLLNPATIRKGENVLEIGIVKREPTAGFARTLTGVEIHLRYREFDRPETLDAATVPPPS